MSSLTPPPSKPQRGVRATFAGLVDGFISWFCDTFYNELVALQANLSSIAAGGAYAITYTHRTSSSNVGGSAGGMLAINAASIQLDTKNAAGASVTALLNSFDDSTRSITGTVRLQKVGDTSKWAVRTVTSYVQGGTGLYGDVFGTLIDSSNGGNPFVDGDPVMLFFQRTGDKGNPGATGFAKFSDRKAAGTGGGLSSASASAYNVRTLNTTDANTFGATLSADGVTLPAGKYVIEARAPAYNVNMHRAAIRNQTDNTFLAYGSNAYAGAGPYPVQSDSVVVAYVELTSSKVFKLWHSTASGASDGLGTSANQFGTSELYSEFSVWKLA
ncbi:MAG: hypothetical protein WCC39_02240 [Telluria sp.]